VTARIVLLASDGTRAIVDEKGDVTLIRGALAFSLRHREADKLVKALATKELR